MNVLQFVLKMQNQVSGPANAAANSLARMAVQQGLAAQRAAAAQRLHINAANAAQRSAAAQASAAQRLASQQATAAQRLANQQGMAAQRAAAAQTAANARQAASAQRLASQQAAATQAAASAQAASAQRLAATQALASQRLADQQATAAQRAALAAQRADQARAIHNQRLAQQQSRTQIQHLQLTSRNMAATARQGIQLQSVLGNFNFKPRISLTEIEAAFGLMQRFKDFAMTIGKGGIDLINPAGYKEQQLLAFTTLLGDATKAQNLYANAAKFAAVTPFETRGVLDATRTMTGFGFSTKELARLLPATSDALSALGKASDENLKDVALVFGQVRSAGRLYAQDAMQLTTRGIPVWSILANKIGKTTGEVKKLSEAGSISGDYALLAITEYFEKTYKGATEKQAKSLFGLASTLKSRPFELFSSLNDTDALNPLKKTMANLASVTDFTRAPGSRIQASFQRGVGGLFKAAFGPLANATEPAIFEKTLDKILGGVTSFIKNVQTGWPIFVSTIRNGWSIANQVFIGFQTTMPKIIAHASEFGAGISAGVAVAQGAWERILPVVTLVASRLERLTGIKLPSMSFGDASPARLVGAALAGVVAFKLLNIATLGVAGGLAGVARQVLLFSPIGRIFALASGAALLFGVKLSDIQGVAGRVLGFVRQMMARIGPLVGQGIAVVGQVLGFVLPLAAQGIDWVLSAAGSLGGRFEQVGQTVGQVFGWLGSFAQGFGAGLWSVIGLAQFLGQSVAAAWGLIQPAAQPVVDLIGQFGNWLGSSGVAQFLGFAAAIGVVGVATGLLVVRTYALATAAAVNGLAMARGWVMAMGPVGWVIAGIVAVGAGLVYAYNNVEWFRNGVQSGFVVVNQAIDGGRVWLLQLGTWWSSLGDHVNNVLDGMLLKFLQMGQGVADTAKSGVFGNAFDFLTGSAATNASTALGSQIGDLQIRMGQRNKSIAGIQAKGDAELLALTKTFQTPEQMKAAMPQAQAFSLNALTGGAGPTAPQAPAAPGQPPTAPFGLPTTALGAASTQNLANGMQQGMPAVQQAVTTLTQTVQNPMTVSFNPANWQTMASNAGTNLTTGFAGTIPGMGKTVAGMQTTMTGGWQVVDGKLIEVKDWFGGLQTNIKGNLQGIKDEMAQFQSAMAGFQMPGMPSFGSMPAGATNVSYSGQVKGAAMQESGFMPGVQSMAQRLGVRMEDILAVMNFESRLDPKARNANSSASGLIQFMESTATSLGTNIGAIRNMSAVEQLPYVEKYLKGAGVGQGTDLKGIYMAVLAGNASRAKQDVLWRQGSKEYAVNAGLDINKDGAISPQEAVNKVITAWQRDGMGQVTSQMTGSGTMPYAGLPNMGPMTRTESAIANKAIQGLQAGWSETAPGYCSRWVRQVMEQTFGSQKTQGLFGATAIKSEENFKKAGLSRDFNQVGYEGLRPGDTLFQGFGSGGAGHIGVYVGNGKVAENTTRNGKQADGDYRELTDIARWGRITSVGRMDGWQNAAAYRQNVATTTPPPPKPAPQKTTQKPPPKVTKAPTKVPTKAPTWGGSSASGHSRTPSTTATTSSASKAADASKAIVAPKPVPIVGSIDETFGVADAKRFGPDAVQKLAKYAGFDVKQMQSILNAGGVSQSFAVSALGAKAMPPAPKPPAKPPTKPPTKMPAKVPAKTPAAVTGANLGAALGMPKPVTAAVTGAKLGAQQQSSPVAAVTGAKLGAVLGQPTPAPKVVPIKPTGALRGATAGLTAGTPPTPTVVPPMPVQTATQAPKITAPTIVPPPMPTVTAPTTNTSTTSSRSLSVGGITINLTMAATPGASTQQIAADLAEEIASQVEEQILSRFERLGLEDGMLYGG